MYSWIWRHLPFGRPGKFAGTAVIIAAVAASLWLWIFPWIEPALPFDDVRIEQPAPGVPAPEGSVTDDPYSIPYSTETNNPTSPSPTPTRTPTP